MATFVALAYGITWGLDGLAFAFGVASGPLLGAVNLLGTLGPTLAAGLVVWLAGGDVRRWARQFTRWRVPRRYYAALLAVPAAVVGLVTLGYLLAGGRFDAAHLALDRLPTYVLVFALSPLLTGGQEEGGWRGFAQPVLQSAYGPLTGTLAVGLLWAGWHASSLVNPSTAGTVPSTVEGAAAFVVSVLAFSVVLAWLYNGTGSVLLVAVLHGFVNVATSVVPVATESVPAVVTTWGEPTAMALLAAAVVVTRNRAGLASNPPDRSAVGLD